MTKNKNEDNADALPKEQCWGVFQEDRKSTGGYSWAFDIEWFPCIPVSEHEAYKKKVKKKINWLQDLTVELVENKDDYLDKSLNWADAEAFFEKMDELVDEIKDIKKELGLSSKEEKKVGELNGF